MEWEHQPADPMFATLFHHCDLLEFPGVKGEEMKAVRAAMSPDFQSKSSDFPASLKTSLSAPPDPIPPAI